MCLKQNLTTIYRWIPCHFVSKCDWRKCATVSGVVGGCSPIAVFLSHVNKLICVRVWGAVVVRSLHLCVLSSLAGWMDWCVWVILLGALSAAWRQHAEDCLLSESFALLLIKVLLSLVTAWHLYLFCFFCCYFFMCLLACPLWVSGATWSTPKGPWQLRKCPSCFSLLLYRWHPIIVSHSLSLCYFSLGSLSLSQPPNDKIELWQLGQGCQFWLPRLLSLSLLPSFNLPFAGLSPSLPPSNPPTSPIFPPLCSVILSQLASNLILFSFLPSFYPPFFRFLPL